MRDGEFIWCDLSTFSLKEACSFYAGVMGWSAHPAGVAGEDYTLCYAGSRPSAAIYTMPDRFQKIGMPSFWMSYIGVDSVERSVATAVRLGAKCEVEPSEYPGGGRFALIRDPAGAGFTLYEGEDLGGRDRRGRHGRMVWNELHVPELGMVEDFYRGVFGWRIEPDPSWPGRYTAASGDGRQVASIVEFDEADKGPKNYWAVVFAVRDLDAALGSLAGAGGELLAHPGAAGGYAMAADGQGAMFCLADKWN